MPTSIETREFKPVAGHATPPKGPDMDPLPSYQWTWEEDTAGGWSIMGLHARDRLQAGTINGSASLIQALARLRHTVTTISDRRAPGGRLPIAFTVGDEAKIIALYETRFGPLDSALD